MGYALFKRPGVGLICALTLILVLLVPMIQGTPDLRAARMKIKNMDYSAAWTAYIKERATLEPAKEYPYEACFREAARANNLPLTLVLAFARGESDFNPKAKSSRSCYGIMQIQWPGTAGDLGFTALEDLYDPCKNIKAGARYIRKMLNRYNGDLHLAVAAYNYGPGRISRNASVIPKGANWYSGYIFHHLEQVLAGAGPSLKPKPKPGPVKPVPVRRKKYRPGTKIPVILFHNPLRARDFMAYFKEKAPDLALDWFRTGLGETYVVLVADTEEDKTRSIRRMEGLGYYLDRGKAFR